MRSVAPRSGADAPGGDALVRLRDKGALALHHLIERLGLVPPELSVEPSADATVVRSEWRRYLRLWHDYKPEELFALKVSAALGLTAIVALGLTMAIFFLL